MLRQVSLFAASALVLAAGGCTLDDFRVNVLGLSADGNGHVINGSLDAVAASTTGSLQKMGLIVTSNRNADTIRLSSSSRTGRGFTLVLRRQKNEQGEQTRVNIEWHKDRDDAFWLELGDILVHGERAAAPRPQGAPLVQESNPMPSLMTGAAGPGRP
jgi:hypothetical protein